LAEIVRKGADTAGQENVPVTERPFEEGDMQGPFHDAGLHAASFTSAAPQSPGGRIISIRRARAIRDDAAMFTPAADDFFECLGSWQTH
jgi:hypothetical protein